MGEKTYVNIIKFLPRYRVAEANKKAISKKNANNKRKTTEQYREELKEKDMDVEVLEEYINAKTQLLHMCNICKYKWKIDPSHMLNSNGCPNCREIKIETERNINYLISHKEKIKEKFNSSIEVLSDSYDSKNKKLTYHCLVCDNIWDKIPYEILRTSGCPKCVTRIKGLDKRMSYEEFVSTITIDNILVVKESYTNTNSPVDCICKVCNYKWIVNQANSLRYLKIGCPKCANNMNLSNEEFLERYKNNINSNIILLEKYANCTTPILCECKICGDLSYKMPKHIINGNGCRKCVAILRGEQLKLTQKEFEDRVKNNNSNVLIVGKYLGYNERVLCKCIVCNNSWNPFASSILNTTGCPFCEMTIGEQLIKNYLDNHNIKYDYEHTYSDLRGINNGLLSYDFYIIEYNLLIEFQGIQHERQTEYFGGEKQFEVQKEHDRRKRQYAKKHNINLLEIWHYDIGNIEKILDDYLNNLKLESVETTGVA